jgi:hypothetical protein
VAWWKSSYLAKRWGVPNVPIEDGTFTSHLYGAYWQAFVFGSVAEKDFQERVRLERSKNSP